jgi:hypothetical protein
MKETPARAQQKRRGKRNASAAGALSILTWEIEVSRDLMLYTGITKEDVSRRSKRNRMVVNRWHKVVRLGASETRAASGAASSGDYTHLKRDRPRTSAQCRHRRLSREN